MNLDLEKLKNNLKEQDNRCTADPIFIVQQKRKIWGIEEGYDPKIAWVRDESVYEKGDKQFETLEKLYDRGRDTGEYRRCGYIEIWDFVTACFTEQGCKDYISVNGHNLYEPRIYAASGYRNREWISLREYFIKG